MLELGNQYLVTPVKPYEDFPEECLMGPEPVIAKNYFQKIGYNQDGALVYDLSELFWLGRQFDLVTDFGTSEHVHCRPGGLLY